MTFLNTDIRKLKPHFCDPRLLVALVGAFAVLVVGILSIIYGPLLRIGPRGVDNAYFISQVVLTEMTAGQTYPVSVNMRNTGTTTWAKSNYRLGAQDAPWGLNRANLSQDVAPGSQTTVNFTVTAPSSAGTYAFGPWRMIKGGSGWFGASTPVVSVTVTGVGTTGTPTPSPSPTPLPTSSPTPTASPTPTPTPSPTPSPTPTPPATSGLYVSTTGSNTNDGLSPGTALLNISTAMTKVTPGMTIFVEGGSYYEHVVTKVAGAAGQDITLTSYNGTAVIDGSTQTWTAGNNQNQGMLELRHRYYRVNGIKVVNSKNTGIVLGADNLTVENTEIAGTQRHAISTDTKYQTNQYAGYMIKNITLANNTISQAVLKGLGYGQAISLIADGFLISGNTLHDNATEAIDIWLGSTHGEVVGNQIYNNQRAGIFVDGSSYVRVHNNKVWNNTRDGIGVASEDTHYNSHDIWVYNNVVYNNQLTGIFIWDQATGSYNGSQNVLIANNTLINNYKINIYLAGDGNTAEIMNNLGYTTGSALYNSATNSTFNVHNNVWLSGLTGFVSPSTGDFRLTSSSPAINKGAPIPVLTDNLGNTFTITSDFLGLNRVVNSVPDAGAYEYQ